MAYQFANNFSQTLATALSEAGTTLELDGGGEALGGASSESPFPLTLILEEDGVETLWEIVYVTAASQNTLTVMRGQEGTTSPAGGWESGAKVACRMTAAAAMDKGQGASSIVMGLDANQIADDQWSVAIGRGASTGHSAGGTFTNTALGAFAAASGSQGVAIGNSAQVDNPTSSGVAIGTNSNAQSSSSLSFGTDSRTDGLNSVAMGRSARTSAQNASAIGPYADSSGVDSTSVGRSAQTTAGYSLAMGIYARTNQPDSIAIGPEAISNMPGGIRCVGIPYLPTAGEGSRFWGDASDGVTDAVRRCSSAIIISSDTLALTDATSTHLIEIPGGGALYIDSVDIVIIDANAPSGNASIKVGSTSGGDDVLGNTPVTVSSINQRQSEVPSSLHGQSELHISVESADTGTQLAARVIFRGYVVR